MMCWVGSARCTACERLAAFTSVHQHMDGPDHLWQCAVCAVVSAREGVSLVPSLSCARAEAVWCAPTQLSSRSRRVPSRKALPSFSRHGASVSRG
eukprot:13659345-Alexandrium_andersonii.AAC.1